jgi:hypothetical protein
MIKLEAEVRKGMGLPAAGPQAAAASATQATTPPQAASQGARVTTMPTGTEGKGSAVKR